MKIEIFNDLLMNKQQSIFLNGNVNFVFGANGSGKTTVLKSVVSNKKTKIEWWPFEVDKMRRMPSHRAEIENENHFDSILRRHDGGRTVFFFESDDFLNIITSPLNQDEGSLLSSEFTEFHFGHEPSIEQLEQKKKTLQIWIDSILGKYIPNVKVIVSFNFFKYLNKETYENRLSSVVLKLDSTTPLSNLSTGERKLLSMIFYSFHTITKGSLVILDEPFSSLHEKLIKDFILLLEDISQTLECKFIISSHTINVIDYSKIENSILISNDGSGIKIINSVNDKSFENGSISSVPGTIKHFSFDSTINTFFQSRVIIVEGFSDKFYFDAMLNGRLQVKQAGGKSNIIKSIFESAWHASEIVVFTDGDLFEKEKIEIQSVLDFVQEKMKVKTLYKTTGDFCNVKNSNIETLVYGEMINVKSNEKVKEALKFKLSGKKEIHSKSFADWLCSI